MKGGWCWERNKRKNRTAFWVGGEKAVRGWVSPTRELLTRRYLPLNFNWIYSRHWLFVQPRVGLVSDPTCQSLADPVLTGLLVPNGITCSTTQWSLLYYKTNIGVWTQSATVILPDLPYHFPSWILPGLYIRCFVVECPRSQVYKPYMNPLPYAARE